MGFWLSVAVLRASDAAQVPQLLLLAPLSALVLAARPSRLSSLQPVEPRDERQPPLPQVVARHPLQGLAPLLRGLLYAVFTHLVEVAYAGARSQLLFALAFVAVPVALGLIGCEHKR